MDGWTIFAWGAVCGMGVLLFLATVANQVQRVERALAETEHRRRKRFLAARRREEEDKNVPVLEVVE